MMIALITVVLALAVVADAAKSSPSTVLTTATAATGAAYTLGASATPPSTVASIEQYYQEICDAPKSCIISSSNGGGITQRNGPCAYNTLHGLSITQSQMQTKLSQKGIPTEATLALKLQSSHVKLERASVGCAFLMYHDAEDLSTNFVEGKLQYFVRGEKAGLDEEADICPRPRTCDFGNSGNGSNNGDGGVLHKPCDDQHYHELKRSREAIETSFNIDASNSEQEMLARQVELTELDAELASVGCALMLQYQVKSRRSALQSDKSTESTESDEVTIKPAPPDRRTESHVEPILIPTLEQYQQDEEKFDHFFHQNYRYFTQSSEMKNVVRGYEAIQDKRRKIQGVLSIAGINGVPDIIWQERVSRENAVERLHGEEAILRRRSLEMLQQGINRGELKLSDLDTTTPADESKHDYKTIWEVLHEQLEEEEEARYREQEAKRLAEIEAQNKEKKEKERVLKKKIRQIWNMEHHTDNDDADLYPSGNPSEMECKTVDGNKGGCAANQSSLSPSDVEVMISRMKNDMEHLRAKAKDAVTDEERDARLSVVREMEKQLKLMMG